MKKRGFTLVELLAVIVLLAIISAIAATTISGVIKKTKINSFLSSFKILNKSLKDKIALGDTNVECDDKKNDNKCSSIYEYDEDTYEMEVKKNDSDVYISRLFPKKTGLLSNAFDNVLSFVDVFDSDGKSVCNINNDILVKCADINLIKKTINGNSYLVEADDNEYDVIDYDSYIEEYEPLLEFIEKIKNYGNKQEILCSDFDFRENNDCRNKLEYNNNNYIVAIVKPYDKYFVYIQLYNSKNNISKWNFNDTNLMTGNDDVSFLMDEKGNTTTNDTGNLYFTNIKIKKTEIEKKYDEMYDSFMLDLDMSSFEDWHENIKMSRIDRIFKEDLTPIKKEIEDYCNNDNSCFQEEVNNNYKILDIGPYSYVIYKYKNDNKYRLDMLNKFDFSEEKINFYLSTDSNRKMIYNIKNNDNIYMNKYQYLYFAYDISYTNNKKRSLEIKNIYTEDNIAGNQNILRIRGEWYE